MILWSRNEGNGMNAFDVLILGSAIVFGIYCFAAYRKNRTSEYRGYLIIVTIGVAVYACGIVLLMIPGLGAVQGNVLREVFFYLFGLGVLLWLFAGIIVLYLKN
jgi:hypothetical protein